MACKNSLPVKRCGGCRYINREAYKGAGEVVCYELRVNDDGKKIAIKTSEGKKACNKFCEANELSVAN